MIQYHKAKAIFHTALIMAETDEMREEARHYIFHCMTNNAYQKQDWKKAEKLSIDVLTRQFSKGVDQSNDSVVEISVKLASIYSINGHFEKAQHGFKFCINAIKKMVQHLVEKPVNEFDDNEKN